jgi:hypothetical protein
MARNASRIKLGYYPLPPAEGARLRRLLDFASGRSGSFSSARKPRAKSISTLTSLSSSAQGRESTDQ